MGSGLDNFKAVFSDETYWASIWRSIVFAVLSTGACHVHRAGAGALRRQAIARLSLLPRRHDLALCHRGSRRRARVPLSLQSAVGRLRLSEHAVARLVEPGALRCRRHDGDHHHPGVETGLVFLHLLSGRSPIHSTLADRGRLHGRRARHAPHARPAASAARAEPSSSCWSST